MKTPDARRTWAYFAWLIEQDMCRKGFHYDDNNPYKEWWERTYNPEGKYDNEVRGVLDFSDEELAPCIAKLEEILGLDDVRKAAARALLEQQKQDNFPPDETGYKGEDQLDETPPF